jgi:hypothetical protein
VNEPNRFEPSFPSATPAFSEYRIVESSLTGKLPDGVYEMLVGDERISLKREHGRFFVRPDPKVSDQLSMNEIIEYHKIDMVFSSNRSNESEPIKWRTN